jgi:beta-galactosidase
MSFDAEWRFTLGDPEGAAQSSFDDGTWRSLSVPHDWSIEGPFSETNKTSGAGGYLPTGIGWYRKHFTLPATAASQNVFIEFDGVMANSEVWANGEPLGKRPYGYVSFGYEMTGHLLFGPGKTNVLAVRVDNSVQPASRWYSGAGIYRHVRLVITEPLHIAQWGTFVTTPRVSSNQALVEIETTLTNQSAQPSAAKVQWIIEVSDGKVVQKVESTPRTVASHGSELLQQEISIKNPELWDIDSTSQPLYRLVAKVSGAATDEETVFFGIRDVHFEAASGFWLNGKNIKIKGVCLHHDAGLFGAAVPAGAWKRRLELLKQVGCNAIRTAHNPPSPEFLSLCDRMGFLVMDELFDCWTVGKGGLGGERLADYHRSFTEWSRTDLRDTVLRDRNHPSVIVYSAGNEIHDTPNATLAKQILKGLVDTFHANDPSRPVSQALFRPNVSHDYTNGLADLLDVVGQNYRENEILAAHEQKPSRKILGTENGHDRKVWLALRDNPPYAGQFLWTGFDYLGESRRWPVIGAGSGLFDRTGSPRPRAFERQSWWSSEPMVCIVRRLEPSRTTPADPGFEPLTRRQLESADWSPPTGELKALGKIHGQVVTAHKLQSAGKAAAVVLSTDCSRLTSEWDDVACIRASIVDENGVLVPGVDELVSFNISGPGIIAGVDNGDNSSHESFRGVSRHAYHGKCIAAVKATGAKGIIQVSASAPGLKSMGVSIEVNNRPK